MLLTSISLSEQFADMPDADCRLIATWTIPHLDREGRVTGSPRRLRALVCPLLPYTDADVARAVEAMCSVGVAVRYTDDSGEDVLWFPKFRKSQGGAPLDREAPSRYGAPPKSLDSCNVMTSHDTSVLARAPAGALASLPFSSLLPDPARTDAPASVQTATPANGTAAALVEVWPELRADVEGLLSEWADAYPGIDYLQLAKEARAKARGQGRAVERPAALLSRWYQRAWNEKRAASSAAFEADHAKRKAAEAAEARLEKQLRVPADAKPVQVGQLLAAITKGVTRGE